MKCANCGFCCRNLYITDRIAISFKLRTFQLSKVCKFLTKDNKCSVYDRRPKHCSEWFCGGCKPDITFKHLHQNETIQNPENTHVIFEP